MHTHYGLPQGPLPYRVVLDLAKHLQTNARQYSIEIEVVRVTGVKYPQLHFLLRKDTLEVVYSVTVTPRYVLSSTPTLMSGDRAMYFEIYDWLEHRMSVLLAAWLKHARRKEHSCFGY